jgi:exodeoxyribonuclease VII large subunit
MAAAKLPLFDPLQPAQAGEARNDGQPLDVGTRNTGDKAAKSEEPGNGGQPLPMGIGATAAKKSRRRKKSPVGSDITAAITGSPSDRQGGEASPPVPPPAPAKMLSVSALIARVRVALADAFPQRVTVVGEVSNFKLHSSGHMYFRLKDAEAAIDAAMFRQHASRLKFSPVDGLEVVVQGRVDVYDPRGQLQLYVEQMTPRGAGALELAFRQLCEKLQCEGLFDPAAKKPLPRFPRAVGIVTSPTGAAIRDICRTLRRRWPAVRAYLFPVLVQGDGAAESIAEGISLLDANAAKFGIDTVIVARGGGSLEDLWAFNEEIVARAIHAAVTPIVTGIGHEIDVTIADMVADVRAATPTAAAELAVPDAADVWRRLEAMGAGLRRWATELLAASSAALRTVLRSALFRDPTSGLRIRHQRLDELSHRLRAEANRSVSLARRRLEPMGGRLASLHPARLAEAARGRMDRLAARLAWALGGRNKRAGDLLAVWQGRLLAAHPAHHMRLAAQRLTAAQRQLEALSYRGVLRRGFSVTRGRDGTILRSTGDVTHGDWIDTELTDGRIQSRVGKPDEATGDRPGQADRA